MSIITQGRPRCGRLAPSPTGALHIGNVRTFLVAWLQMRVCGGKIRLRIEDLDHPKHKPGAETALIEDLQWLGFDWDGTIVRQTERYIYYETALKALAPGLYPCYCSRADIQRAQSAPHPGEVLRYPGTCRPFSSGVRPFELLITGSPAPAWRVALTEQEDGRFTDGFFGPYPYRAAELTGDFVVARGREPAYTLAVVVDDAAMNVTDVVRGDDILPVTPAQYILYHRLGLPPPTFFHIPLVIGIDGRRLAKRHGDTRISSYRTAGIEPGRLLSALGRSCGWLSSSEQVNSPLELLPRFSLETIPRTPFVWHDSLL